MCVWPLVPCWDLAVQAFSGPQIQMEWIVIDNYDVEDDDDDDGKHFFWAINSNGMDQY